MFIDSSTLQERLKDPKSLPNITRKEEISEKIEVPTSVNQIPDHKRVNIAVESELNGVKPTALKFGISPKSVSDIRDGKSIGDIPKEEFFSDKNSKLVSIREVAMDVTHRALSKITDDKLEDLSAKEASLIAAQTSKVIQSTFPKEASSDSGTKIQVVVYSPTVKKSSKDLEVIEV